MVKVRLHAPVKSMSGKTGFYTYRWTHGKQTLMKTPDTPALARRCKCVQGQMDRGADGKPRALSPGDLLCQASDGGSHRPCLL